MRINIIFLLTLVFAFIPFIGATQTNLQISANKSPIYISDADTISTCRDTVITFFAFAINGTDTLQNVHFYWDFDDNTKKDGIDLDTLEHSFVKGGGYRVKLFAQTPFDTVWTILPVQVAKKNDFSQTKANYNGISTFESICLGSKVELIGNASTVIWRDQPVYKVSESPGTEFTLNKPYVSELFFDEFSKNALFTGSEIDSIGINLEHSDLAETQIEISCPTGQKVILKNSNNTGNATFGQPIADNNPNNIGIGGAYYWSTSALPTLSTTTTGSAAEIAYQPAQNLSQLIGCPLNGAWKIELTNNNAAQNGFVFNWEIVFKQAILPKKWDFRDTLYNAYKYPDNRIFGTIWEGTGAGGTSLVTQDDTVMIGTSNAIPESYDQTQYKFRVINNWGCPADTSIIIKVTQPIFTPSPQSGNAPLNVNFADQTPWSETSAWLYGDFTGNESEGKETAHLYLEKGKYKVILKSSDAQGCNDTVSVMLDVQVEPSSITEIPNVFSPNQDGTNDLFILDAKGMQTFRITIYSRWGEKVYSSTSAPELKEAGWDGKMPLTKIKATPGTYFYVLVAKGKDGKDYNEKGTIILFR